MEIKKRKKWKKVLVKLDCKNKGYQILSACISSIYHSVAMIFQTTGLRGQKVFQCTVVWMNFRERGREHTLSLPCAAPATDWGEVKLVPYIWPEIKGNGWEMWESWELPQTRKTEHFPNLVRLFHWLDNANLLALVTFKHTNQTLWCSSDSSGVRSQTERWNRWNCCPCCLHRSVQPKFWENVGWTLCVLSVFLFHCEKKTTTQFW